MQVWRKTLIGDTHACFHLCLIGGMQGWVDVFMYGRTHIYVHVDTHLYMHRYIYIDACYSVWMRAWIENGVASFV